MELLEKTIYIPNELVTAALGFFNGVIITASVAMVLFDKANERRRRERERLYRKK